MSNCVLYSRFSPRPRSNECDSVEKQIAELKEYCLRNNHTVIGIFSDKCMSGDDVDRPALFDAIYTLKKDSILLITYWDRLARSSYLSEILQMQIKKKGAAILAIHQAESCQANPESKLVRTILLAIAEYQRGIICARTRAAMLRMQKEGRRMSAAHLLPYGQMIDPADNSKMIPNPDEQVVIEKIIKWRREGLTLRGIADWLNREGYVPRTVRKTWKGEFVQCKGIWRHTIVRSILNRAS